MKVGVAFVTVTVPGLVAEAELPPLETVTVTDITRPTSPEVTMYELFVAPEIGTPALSHW